MNNASLILRILAIVGALLALIGWALTNQSVRRSEVRLAEVTTELTAAQTAANSLNARLETTQRDLEATRSNLNAVTIERDSVNATLVQSRRDLEQRQSELRSAQTALNQSQSTVDILRGELSTARAAVREVQDMEARLARLEALEREVADLTTARSTLQNRVRQLEGQLAARLTAPAPTASGTTAGAPTGTATIGTPAAAATPVARVPAPIAAEGLRPLEGSAKVLRVATADGLVIINQGRGDGRTVGEQVAIATEFSRPIQGSVTRVFDTISVLSILPDQGDWSFFKEGDTVTLLK